MSVSAVAPNAPGPAREKPAVTVEARADTTPLTTFADEEASFWDFVDVINPLQHIPVVNVLYRELTGDSIGAAARVAGGTLFAGPIGLGLSVADLVIEDASGQSLGEHVLTAMGVQDAQPSSTGARPNQYAFKQTSDLDELNGLMHGEDLWAQRFGADEAAVAVAAAPAQAAPIITASAEPPAPAAAPQAPVSLLPPSADAVQGPTVLPIGAEAANQAVAALAAQPAPVRVASVPSPANTQVFEATREPVIQQESFRPVPQRGGDRFMPMPQRAGEARLMPVPNRPGSTEEMRKAAEAARAAAPVRPDAATVERVLGSQAGGNQTAPLPLYQTTVPASPNGGGSLPTAPVDPTTAAAAIKAQQSGGSPLQDQWFSNNVSQALDKYRKANQLNAAP